MRGSILPLKSKSYDDEKNIITGSDTFYFSISSEFPAKARWAAIKQLY